MNEGERMYRDFLKMIDWERIVKIREDVAEADEAYEAALREDELFYEGGRPYGPNDPKYQ